MSILYYQVRVFIYRTPVAKLDARTGKLIKPPREFVALVGPYNVKRKEEVKTICRAIAHANKGMGAYDWDFVPDWLGTVSSKAKEAVDGSDNKAPCPRCGKRLNSNSLCECSRGN